jgi:uncharacterized protein (DUF427 family)
MKATYNKQTIAQADKADLIYIEGNWYFPKSSIKADYYQPSNTHTSCFWKGEASYYNIVVDGQTNEDAAWYYPTPMPGATARVKKDFTNYVAFWRGVEITE